MSGTVVNKSEQGVNDLGYASSSVPREENLLLQLCEKITGLPNLLTSVDSVIYTVHTLEPGETKFSFQKPNMASHNGL